jgi:hypothetical protein
MNKTIHEKLKEIARTQDITTYSDIAPLAGLDMGSQDDRNRIAGILGEISRYEHTLGHPMLSVVVVHKANNIPGQGFFTLARELGLYRGNDDLLFFTEELRKVHEFWRIK